jgi:hypothetical protein
MPEETNTNAAATRAAGNNFPGWTPDLHALDVLVLEALRVRNSEGSEAEI